MIKQRRIAMGLTQRELADKAGVTKNYVTMVERGARRSVSFMVRVNLADALEIPVTQVLSPEEARRLPVIEGAFSLQGHELVVWALQHALQTGAKPHGSKFAAAVAIRTVAKAHPERKKELDSLRGKLNELFP